ncbi:hypothetical protein THAOC_03837 [Thalassiosira oceanica]|uniref:BTB domain-containing protein n=1 Tax=Thalassiosira oceanica TaxID=159749 RepID=K0TBH1_THAOC|nr:hypothetical protein THAOC_03837 [Thalassiosira oceanica]|eukprot:EJK74479.1 hypothetical protein THAOC_03837 [Thalassiosira oceanica]
MIITRLEPVQVGAQPTGQLSDGQLSGWVIAPVCFNGFAGLPTTKGECVTSPEFSCFGHQWGVTIYPGGERESTDGYVALYLQNRTRESIEVELKFIIKDPNGGEDIFMRTSLTKFKPKDSAVVGNNGPTHGYRNFALRSTLTDYLDDGTLIVEVHIRTNKPGQQYSSFVPENPFLRNALTDFDNEETADVKFEVGGTVEATIFYAHHIFLRLNAPALADMCKPGDDSPTTISNVRPDIFEHLLYNCYGGKISKQDLQSDAKDIIEAADRFCIVHLKLEAEACYVDTVELTLDNIHEVVTYADSKNLALLKEHCMDFLSSANKIEAAEKVSFGDIPSHLMKDLLVAQARREAASGKAGGIGDLEMKSVSELREMAHEEGLSVDSSREMLIASIRGDEDDAEVEE